MISTLHSLIVNDCRKVYVQAFGQAPCSACHRKTSGKLCDYVVGSCGGYFSNCVALCSRCHKRAMKAVFSNKLADQPEKNSDDK